MTGLTVTAGGAAAVATDDLTRTAARLDAVADRLRDHAAVLALPPVSGTHATVHEAEVDLARHLLARSAEDAGDLAAELRRAAAEYADGERVVDRCVRAAGEGAAADAPSGLVGLAGEALRDDVDLVALLGVLGAVALRPDGPARVVLPTAVRHAVSDVAAGAARFLPRRPPGDDGTRETTAGLLAVLGTVGLLRDAPSVVRSRPDALRPPPGTMADLAARVPDPGPGPQMRVERYRMPDGGARFVAYLGGIQTLAPTAGREGFDLASASTALATEDGSAVRAAEQALRDAGATASDEVYVVGYSMGGIVARSIGDDPGFRVAHEVTFGSPVEQLPLRHGVDGVAVEHADDPVPALGGARPTGDAAGREVVVRSTTTDLGQAASGDAVSAHQLPTYRATAAQMDGSAAPALVEQRARLREFLAGAVPEASHLYEAERTGSGGGLRPGR